MPPMNCTTGISLRLSDNTLNGNDSSHDQLMAKTYEITNLNKNVKNAQKL